MTQIKLISHPESHLYRVIKIRRRVLSANKRCGTIAIKSDGNCNDAFGGSSRSATKSLKKPNSATGWKQRLDDKLPVIAVEKLVQGVNPQDT